MLKGYSRRRGPDERALEEARRLVGALEARGLRVEEAYVFGSRARGDYLEGSDLDIVIVSRGFEGMRYLDRLDLIYKVAWEEGIEYGVEAVALTPEELRERLEGLTMLRDASRHWIRVR